MNLVLNVPAVTVRNEASDEAEHRAAFGRTNKLVHTHGR